MLKSFFFDNTPSLGSSVARVLTDQSKTQLNFLFNLRWIGKWCYLKSSMKKTFQLKKKSFLIPYIKYVPRCRKISDALLVVFNSKWFRDFSDTVLTSLEGCLEEGTATHSTILLWRIPWTEEPGRLQSTGLHRDGHDCSKLACTQAKPQLATSDPLGNLWCD